MLLRSNNQDFDIIISIPMIMKHREINSCHFYAKCFREIIAIPSFLPSCAI